MDRQTDSRAGEGLELTPSGWKLQFLLCEEKTKDLGQKWGRLQKKEPAKIVQKKLHLEHSEEAGEGSGESRQPAISFGKIPNPLQINEINPQRRLETFM